MVLSESIVRAIHADRVRVIERATRDRRLIVAASEASEADATSWSPVDPRVVPASRSRTKRTGLPA
jgi:hypothetical protein